MSKKPKSAVAPDATSAPAPQSAYGKALVIVAETVRHVIDLTVGGDRLRANAKAQGDVEIILASARA